MTDHRTYTAAFVLAPLAAGALSFATVWALDHDPHAGASPSASVTPASGASTSSSTWQATIAAASRRDERARVHLQDAMRRIEANTRRLQRLSGSDHPSAGPAVAPAALPPVPAAPPAPPVNTTTGAS